MEGGAKLMKLDKLLFICVELQSLVTHRILKLKSDNDTMSQKTYFSDEHAAASRILRHLKGTNGRGQRKTQQEWKGSKESPQ